MRPAARGLVPAGVPVLKGAVLVGAVLVAGCGTLAETHHRPGTSHEVVTGAAGVPPGERHADIVIKGGRVSPPPGWLEVAKGGSVSLTVTSDVADTVHVHGYDVEAAVTPGVPVTLRFTANMTGVFEVETHGSGLVLTQVAVK
ncbi:hypothetical protein [Nonomuraea sp. NPDC050310]|uniref:hypothetical protein n=1 Tax=Nonomuraea sp. NPDC050310 TaxID=3154935 RepID=UPI0033DDD24C